MQHLIDLDDYPVSWWNRVIALGKDIYTNPGRYKGACSGKVMGTLFYEPSTRTQMSFQTAMLRLGGSLIGFDNPATSSVSKGENLKDTTKIVSGYSDVLVIRHPQEGAAKAAALTAECPVINAGDGGHLHPTQTLTDMLTLTMEKGRLSDLVIGMCGDLLNGRTVHSLCKALSCYPNNKFIFISTPELMVPQYVKDILNSHGCEYKEVSSLEETIPELDVLYMTRIQSERFTSVEEYEAQKNVYVLDRKKLNLGKSDLIVLHPLPRVDEITMDVDEDSRALYFKQTKYGVYVRMALVLTMIENKDTVQLLKGSILNDTTCTNPRCITHSEKYLPKSFIKSGDIAECEFCDERVLL
ncbi:MAG: aspartate carbamoyltransferase [Oscillospiraceae bacterium]|nr:aspartate carbamoyltransferase [Oscillospiraceae bacterium]MBR6924886.1 aspartate carbamoyltransferase [Oscillospiraceae bacterium]